MIDRLRPKLEKVAGARLFLQPGGQIRAGGRQGNGAYQYTILGDTLEDLNEWVPKITTALQDVPELEDVNSDQPDKGLEVDLKIDRATAARLGLNAAQIDNALYDAFGQRQVSTIYKDKNQYHVVMEVAPAFWQSPETLHDVYVSTSGGTVSGTQASAAAGGAFVIANTSSSASAGGRGRHHHLHHHRQQHFGFQPGFRFQQRDSPVPMLPAPMRPRCATSSSMR